MKEYYPKRYLTEELLLSLLPQLKLDVPYKIVEDLPDGIEVCFPKSSIYISEYAEGEIAFYFLANKIGTEKDLTLSDAISIIAPGVSLADEFPIKEHLPFSSQEKVINQLINYFYVVKKYLYPFIHGDYSWIEKYREVHRQKE